MLCLLLLGGILSETGMQGGILPQTVQAAGRYTGWKTVSGKRYYYQNGRMLKGMSKIGNDYYCFNYQGVQLKGWVYTKNHYRYFDKRSGKMRRNTTIQGRKINSNGVWVPVVVLDPGHSGVQMSGYEPLGPGSSERKAKCSSGTEGVATGIGEYQLTLNIAKKLRTALIAQGCRVIMTRNDNKTRISCAQRAGVANRAKADAYLRIHASGLFIGKWRDDNLRNLQEPLRFQKHVQEKLCTFKSSAEFLCEGNRMQERIYMGNRQHEWK